MQCYSCQHNVCARKVPLFANLNEEEILKEVKKLLHQKQKDKDLTFEEMVKAKIQDRGL